MIEILEGARKYAEQKQDPKINENGSQLERRHTTTGRKPLWYPSAILRDYSSEDKQSGYKVTSINQFVEILITNFVHNMQIKKLEAFLCFF